MRMGAKPETKASFDIVVIEDDKGLNHLICKNLKREGYNCAQAFTGADALKAVTQRDNQILLLDFRLPDMTGKELVEKLTQKQGRTPNFLVMTGFGAEKIAVEMMKLGAKQYIVKEAYFIEILVEQVNLTVADIIRQKELEQAKEHLEASRQDFQELFNTMAEGVVYQNNKGEIISANPAAKRILGMTWEQMTGITSIEPRWKAVDENYNELSEEDYPGMVALEKGKRVNNFLQGIFIPEKNDYVWIVVNSVPQFRKGESKPYQVYSTFTEITERIKTKQLIQESEEKYRSIFENIQDTYYEVTLDGIILEVSPSVKNLSKGQITQEDLVGTSLLQFYKNPEERNHFLNELQKKGFINDYELDLKNRDGSVINCSFSSKLITNTSGQPIKIVGSIRDITARKKAETELRRAEKKFRSLIEHAPDGVVIIDKNGIITYGSPNAFHQFGYNENDIIGHSGEEFTHPDDIYKVAKVFEKIFSNPPQSVTEKYRFQRKNGEYRWIETTFTNLLKDKAVEGIVLNFSDITEQKQAEEELIRAKEKAEENEFELNEAQKLSKLGSWQFDVKTGTSVWSKEMARIWGIENPNDLIGYRGSKKYIHPEDWKNFDKAVKNAIKNGEAYTVEYRIKTRGGKEKTVISIGEPEFDENGTVIKLRGSVQDISDRKRIENELVKAKEKAEESDRLKSAFLANMSHEIRTPMNGILGFTNLIKEPDITGEQLEEYINIIQKSGTRMLDTLNDLIDIARIETGQVELEMADVDIAQELKNLHVFFEPEAANRNLIFDLNINCIDTGLMVKTDRTKVISVLTNLIKNALKYTPEGRIEIRCKKKKNSVELFVEDTGIGIPKDVQKNIFKRFVQVEQGYTRKYEGSGLGLSISKAYAQILGGEIHVESEEGKGSTFCFSLPVNQNTEQKIQTSNTKDSSNSVQKSSLENLTVLVAEDDEVSRLHLKILLEKKVDRIFYTETGRKAVELCKAESAIDVILMDIKMPDMNGYEAVRKIRSFNKTIPIIAQTAYALEGDREKALEAGCDEYLPKPLDQTKLLKLLNELTNK